MGGIIGVIIIGLLAGAVAKFLMPGKDGGGWVMTILLGIAGSVVGSYLGSALGIYPEGAGGRFVAATIGAMIILFIYRAFKKKS